MQQESKTLETLYSDRKVRVEFIPDPYRPLNRSAIRLNIYNPHPEDREHPQFCFLSLEQALDLATVLEYYATQGK